MRRFSFLVMFICILSACCIPVSAHPGKTDANGGHINHSTGDYHYHHGYSAHNHYDMDGDGSIDCPYDYDNRVTKYNSVKSREHQNATNPEHKTEVHSDNQKIGLGFGDITMLVGVAGAFMIMITWVVAIFNEDVGRFILSLGFRLMGLFIVLLIFMGCYNLVKFIFDVFVQFLT